MSFALATFFAILGAVVGSFAGVVAERLHTGESWISGRSRCNSCARPLAVHDLIPVLSWLFSYGRCRVCRSRVPVLYAIVESTLALVFILAYGKLGLGLPLLFFLLSVAVLAVIVLYDLRHTIVPQIGSVLLVAFSLEYAVLSAGDLLEFGATLLVAGLIGGAFLLAFLLSKGRMMGLGDAPVAFGLALLAGSQAIPGLLFSFWIGALVGIAILVRRPKGHRMGVEVPFVPFMAFGFLLAFFTSWNPLGLVIGY